MKVKNFFAPDMRKALQMVRDEFGADAVILSQSKVSGGVEICAAPEYDPQLHAPAQTAKTPERPSLPGSMLDPQRLQEELQQTRMELASMRAKLRDSERELKEVQERPQPKREEPPVNNELKTMRDELSGLRDLIQQQLGSVSWGDFSYRRPHQAGVMRRFSAMGISADICHFLVDKSAQFENLQGAWKASLMQLMSSIGVMADDNRLEQGIVALVGPAGVGKTTTAAKIAARYALKYGVEGLALVTTDNHRIGGDEQLRAVGRILNVPVRVVDEMNPLEDVLKSLHEKKFILIDTAGIQHKDGAWLRQLEALRTCNRRITSLLVLPATAQLSVLERTVREYSRLAIAGCILTKLDETASLGEALSIVIRHQLRVAFITDGQRIPDDLHPARAHYLVSQAVKMTQQIGSSDDENMAKVFAAQPYRPRDDAMTMEREPVLQQA